jgi:phosphohistidine phosphatase
MKLLIIRHAAAVPRGTPGMADDDRPLTPQGERKFRAAAKGLARVVDRPDLLLSSPLPRAKATADIAARAFRRVEAKVEPALAGESVEGIVAALRKVASTPTVAIVGHEPVLSALLAHLLEASRPERLSFKKGGAGGTRTLGLVPKAPNTKDTCGRLGSAFDAARVVRSHSRSNAKARTVSSGSSP